MQSIIRNLSKIFVNIQLFPDVEVKLLSLQRKSICREYEEVEHQNKILKNGFYPILEIRRDHHNNQQIKYKSYYKDNKLHRDIDQASRIKYFKSGQIKFKKYFKDNSFYREGKPALVKYFKSGQIRCKYFFKDNKFYREHKPSLIEYYRNGQIRHESYLKYNKHHREGDNPSYITYYENGNIKIKTYHKNIIVVIEKSCLERFNLLLLNILKMGK